MLNSEREEHVNMELRAAREKAGLTQTQVAQCAEVTDRMYQDYEYNKSEPGVRTAIRIARALDSTVEELFGGATPDTINRRGYLFGNYIPDAFSNDDGKGDK